MNELPNRFVREIDVVKLDDNCLESKIFNATLMNVMTNTAFMDGKNL